MVSSIANLTSVFCLHTVKRLNSSIWPIDVTLKGIAPPSQSGPESNTNESVIHIPRASKLQPHH